MMHPILLSALVSFPLFLAGCAQTETYSKEKHASYDCSMQKQMLLEGGKKVGAESYREIPSQTGVLTSVSTDAAIQQIAAPLRTAWETPSFPPIFVTSQLTPGAFSGRNGAIFISLGTLLSAESDDEIAATLAHEMGHVSCGHLSKGDDSWDSLSLLFLPMELSSEVISTSAETVIERRTDANRAPRRLVDISASSLRNRGWSRRHEMKADLVAVDTLIKAGYNENALSAAILKNPDEQDESSSILDMGIFSGASHPSAQERVNSVSAYIGAAYSDHDPPPFRTTVLAGWKNGSRPLVENVGHLLKARQALVNPLWLFGIAVKPLKGTERIALEELRAVFRSKARDGEFLASLANGTFVTSDPDTLSLSRMFLTRWMAAETLARMAPGNQYWPAEGERLLRAPDVPIGFVMFAATTMAYRHDYKLAMETVAYGIKTFPDNYLAICETLNMVNAYAEDAHIPEVLGKCLFTKNSDLIKKFKPNVQSGSTKILHEQNKMRLLQSMEYYFSNSF